MFLSVDFVSTSVEACRAYVHPLMLQVLLLSESFYTPSTNTFNIYFLLIFSGKPNVKIPPSAINGQRSALILSDQRRTLPDVKF
jgi:hypothetical protein